MRSSTATGGTGISRRQTKLKQNALTGGRSWHHYHNGGPRHESIFLSYDELRAVSFEIKPYAASHASPCGTRARTQLAHKILPTLRDIGARFVAQYIYVKCYSSLTDSVNTTSNIAIPYASSLS